jgi:hypothetical protein
VESNRMGLSPRAWFAYERLGYGPLAVLIDYMVELDPTYFDDFWTKPGYLGFNPPESLKRARVQQATKITRIVMSDEARKMGMPAPMAAVGTQNPPAAFQFEATPAGDLKGSTLFIKSGAAMGQKLSISAQAGDLCVIGIGQDAFQAVSGIKVGDEVMIDNSIYLAAQTHHRHEPAGKDYYIFDQFIGSDGKRIYPLRQLQMGPKQSEQGCGSIEDGTFGGKMIVIETLVDEYASPWNGDWYHQKVKSVLGSKIDDSFRIWMIDNAMHGSLPYTKKDGIRISGYFGALQQALRDVSTWVEKGTPPPATSNYKIVDSQVIVAEKAADRKSIQPTVKLTANGSVRADVKVGQAVSFSGVVEVPPGTGSVVVADWDFEGTGDYPVTGEIKPTNASGSHATVTTTYTFSKPGTYFPVLRAGSQRKPDGTPFARVMNLDRVRVVVT